MNGDNSDTITKLLDTFQECKRRGDQAKLFLETRNGSVFANLVEELPVSPPGRRPFKNKKKTPSSLRRDHERMEKFIQRKKSEETFSTSTPEKSNQPSIASTTSDMDASGAADSISCETPELDSRAGNQDDETEQTTPADEGTNINQEIFKSKERFEVFLKQMDNIIQRTIKETINEQLSNSVTEERINDEDMVNNDNIEDAKKWAVNQKQSLIIHSK